MACSNTPQNPLRRLVRDAALCSPNSLPIFLVPSVSKSTPWHTRRRQESTLATATSTSIPSISSLSTAEAPASSTPVSAQKSRIGRAPITVPPEVSLRFYDLPKGIVRSRHPDTPSAAVDVAGPLGQLTVALPPYLKAELDQAAKKVNVSVENAEEKHQRAMWGTMRALLQNSISGVGEGHSIILRLVGVGYRATIEPTATTTSATHTGQKFVNLKLGYAHPVELGIPQGVTASTPQPTRILLEGVDKQVVKQFAAEIRRWRKPEPYKGKGIFVGDETIRLKAKKIK